MDLNANKIKNQSLFFDQFYESIIKKRPQKGSIKKWTKIFQFSMRIVGLDTF